MRYNTENITFNVTPIGDIYSTLRMSCTFFAVFPHNFPHSSDIERGVSQNEQFCNTPFPFVYDLRCGQEQVELENATFVERKPLKSNDFGGFLVRVARLELTVS